MFRMLWLLSNGLGSRSDVSWFGSSCMTWLPSADHEGSVHCQFGSVSLSYLLSLGDLHAPVTPSYGFGIGYISLRV